MTRGQFLFAAVVVLLIMFAPVFLADLLVRFFTGLVAMYHQFT